MKIKFNYHKQLRFGIGFYNDSFIIDFFCFTFSLKRNSYSWEDYTPKSVVLSSSVESYLRWCLNTNRNPKNFKYIRDEKQLLLELDSCDEIYLVGEYKLESLEVINRLSAKSNCVVSKVL